MGESYSYSEDLQDIIDDLNDQLEEAAGIFAICSKQLKEAIEVIDSYTNGENGQRAKDFIAKHKKGGECATN